MAKNTGNGSGRVCRGRVNEETELVEVRKFLFEPCEITICQ
jgi:hypothetical protein